MELSAPQRDIALSTQNVNLFLGGQGSGKSHVLGSKSAEFITNFPAARGLIAANTYGQLNRSTMFRVREVWKDLGIVEYDEKTGQGDYVLGKQPPSHFKKLYSFDRYDSIVSFSWGAVVYIGSLDAYKALDGMEITWAMLDETKDTKETAVKEVIVGRLRQRAIYLLPNGEMVGDPNPADTVAKQSKDYRPWVPPADSVEFNPLYVFTSPAKVPWLNDWFELDTFADEIKREIYTPPTYFKKKFKNKFVTISATHLNQKNLPKNYISNQMSNMSKGLQNMLIYGDPFSKAGGEFYKGFDQTRQIVTGLREYFYDPALPLHITFDFNVKPYITLCVWQIKGKKACQIDEFCLESPNNSTVRLCKTFVAKYGTHRGGLFVCGDPAGKAESTKLEDGANEYTLVMRELASMRPRNIVPSKAPAVAMRGEFFNGIFESSIYGIELLFDDRCKFTIGDYLYLKEAADGTKLKQKVKDEGTEALYEKYGHTSDANDYLITTVFFTDWSNFLNGGNAPVVQSGGGRATNRQAF